MLTSLNSMFDLQISDEELAAFAGKLGADSPFFLHNSPVYAQGTGDILTPLPLSLKGYRIVVVKPPVFVSTREAFSRVTPKKPEVTLDKKILLPIEEWKEIITNDFETSVFALHPELQDIKQKLYDKGALYAAMSGSGSALYGLFPLEGYKATEEDFPNCFVWEAIL